MKTLYTQNLDQAYCGPRAGSTWSSARCFGSYMSGSFALFADVK